MIFSSKALSLLAGIVASDGHLERDGCGIKVINSSKPFVDEVVIPLLEEVSSKKPSVYVGKTGFSNKTKYIAYVYDKKTSKILSEEYAIPLGKKAETVLPPNNLSDSDKLDYVRGWFAGEGSVSTDVHKQGDRTYFSPEIMLWVKNPGIAGWIAGFLNSLGIQAKLFHSSKKLQSLVIIRQKESLFLFQEKVGFAHPEKDGKLKIVLAPRASQNQNVARQFGGIF